VRVACAAADDARGVAWARAFFDAVAPHAAGSVYSSS
jgi:hypothetical protein